MKQAKPHKTPRRMRGFERASGLVASRIQKASEQRGFAVSKLLTHWAEIVGEEVAAIARPVNVGYGRGGFGATLTLLTTGAQAPMVQMQVEQIKERVNACYGYAAIRHVRLTQTAPTGFAEGQAQFIPAPKPQKKLSPQTKAQARRTTEDVKNEDLRQALETLGQNVLSRDNSN